jgi:hypothetical protein
VVVEKMDDYNESTHDNQQTLPMSASTEPGETPDTLQSNDVIELQAFLEVCFFTMCYTLPGVLAQTLSATAQVMDRRPNTRVSQILAPSAMRGNKLTVFLVLPVAAGIPCAC